MGQHCPCRLRARHCDSTIDYRLTPVRGELGPIAWVHRALRCNASYTHTHPPPSKNTRFTSASPRPPGGGAIDLGGGAIDLREGRAFLLGNFDFMCMCAPSIGVVPAFIEHASPIKASSISSWDKTCGFAPGRDPQQPRQEPRSAPGPTRYGAGVEQTNAEALAGGAGEAWQALPGVRDRTRRLQVQGQPRGAIEVTRPLCGCAHVMAVEVACRTESD